MQKKVYKLSPQSTSNYRNESKIVTVIILSNELAKMHIWQQMAGQSECDTVSHHILAMIFFSVPLCDTWSKQPQR